MFYVTTSPRVLVVYVVYYTVLCYIPQGTGGVYGVLHRSMLHLPGNWWYKWSTTSVYVTSPMKMLVYMVYFIVIYYILQDTGDISRVIHHSMLHLPGYWWYIRCITTFKVTPPGY